MAITNKMNKPSDRKGLLKLVKILQEENKKLKGYIEGLEKQLIIPVVVGMCCDDIALKNKIRLVDLDRCVK
jgi:hypothetical protein